jgi:pSer/pThr/pTyr-binding forkhead associated (FHA) protein
MVRAACPQCGASNPEGYRFCVACGAPLAQPAAPVATPIEPARAHGSAGRVEAIVGAPVVGIAAIERREAQLVTCSRCHGQCAAGTRFCKFCGAALADAGALARPQVLDAPVRPRDAGRRDEARATPEASGGSPARGPGAYEAPARARPIPRSDVEIVRPSPVAQGARAAARSSGRLVIIVEDGSEGAKYPLTGTQLDVGRTEGDIRLEGDLYVSPRHARLLADGTGWVLRDLGSANGVFMRLKKPYPLRDADLLLLGLEVLQFETVSDGERGLGHAVQHGTLLFGTPAAPRHARLRQRTVEGVTRDVYHLIRDETVIGRETGDIVFTSDPFLSRRHAMIRRHPATGEHTLEDLDSSNGTFAAIRRDVPLANGDFVRIGQHLFRVDLD